MEVSVESDSGRGGDEVTRVSDLVSHFRLLASLLTSVGITLSGRKGMERFKGERKKKLDDGRRWPKKEKSGTSERLTCVWLLHSGRLYSQYRRTIEQR